MHSYPFDAPQKWPFVFHFHCWVKHFRSISPADRLSSSRTFDGAWKFDVMTTKDGLRRSSDFYASAPGQASKRKSSLTHKQHKQTTTFNDKDRIWEEPNQEFFQALHTTLLLQVFNIIDLVTTSAFSSLLFSEMSWRLDIASKTQRSSPSHQKENQEWKCWQTKLDMERPSMTIWLGRL